MASTRAMSFKATSGTQRAGLCSRRSMPVAPRRVAMNAGIHGDDSVEGSEVHFTADCIAWHAKNMNVLRQRIAKVRAAEVVSESLPSRPELGIASDYDAEMEHARLCAWHEQQWERLRNTQANAWEDELGHFGAPS